MNDDYQLTIEVSDTKLPSYMLLHPSSSTGASKIRSYILLTGGHDTDDMNHL
jgi:hypothetical protein